MRHVRITLLGFFKNSLTFLIKAVFSFGPNFAATFSIITFFQAEFLLNTMR